MNSTYRSEFSCENCDETFEMNVPKGTEVTEFCKDKKCPNCGCITVVLG